MPGSAVAAGREAVGAHPLGREQLVDLGGGPRRQPGRVGELRVPQEPQAGPQPLAGRAPGHSLEHQQVPAAVPARRADPVDPGTGLLQPGRAPVGQPVPGPGRQRHRRQPLLADHPRDRRPYRRRGDAERFQQPDQGGHRRLPPTRTEVVPVEVEERGTGVHPFSLPARSGEARSRGVATTRARPGGPQRRGEEPGCGDDPSATMRPAAARRGAGVWRRPERDQSAHGLWHGTRYGIMARSPICRHPPRGFAPRARVAVSTRKGSADGGDEAADG